MKKSLLITLDFPPYTGGVANYYANICKHLPPEDINVLAPKIQGSESFDNSAQFRIYRKKLLSTNPFRWPKWPIMIKPLRDIIQKENIEHLLVGNVLPIGTVAWYLKKTINISYSVFCHGMDITKPQGRKKFLIKKILSSAEAVFTNSNSLRKKIHDFDISASRIHVVYPCPNIEPQDSHDDQDELKKKYDFTGKKILLTVGRLVKRKGHSFVLRALADIQEKYPDIIYVIAGSGPKQFDLENLSKNLRLKNKVFFIENPSDLGLSELYEMCDIFVMTPVNVQNDVEGFGMVYLEASSFSKPVIATRMGGVDEAVIHDKTGILVEPNSHSAIATAICDLIENNQNSHRLGLQGLDRVHEKFQWSIQAEIIKKVLSL